MNALPDIRLANVLEYDGSTIEWEAVGAGEPLLWIEGGPGFWAHLARPDVALLADRFRAYLVNAPGCGRTSAPSEGADYGLDSSIRFVDDARNALGLERVTIMGHSWGGLAAVAYAAAYPDAVRRLVVIDGYAGVGSVEADAAEAESEAALDRVRNEPWFEEAVAAIPDWAPTEPEQIARFSSAWPLYFADPESEVARHHIARIRSELRWNLDFGRVWDPDPDVDLRPALANIRCPTLVIVGEHDFVCGPAWNRPIAEGIPGARFEIISGAGHMPQYEAADEVRRIIGEWLDATEVAPRR
jgi:pimeloyl-ACP methyl ester carboxylesterase